MQLKKIKRKIRQAIRKQGFEVLKIGQVDLLESLIYYYYHKNFFFVQIGANDGRMVDPIYQIAYELNLSGLVIEPIKEYFNELSRNYSRLKKVVPVNKAIYSENRLLKMNKIVLDEHDPFWLKGMASINLRDNYKQLGISPKKIIEEEVDAITFEKLIEYYKISCIDLLQMDTEGYDYYLLKLFPFNRFNPKIIQFEHGMSGKLMTKVQFLEICALLVNNGYNLITKPNDCIAYK